MIDADAEARFIYERRALYEGEAFIDRLATGGKSLERELHSAFGPELEVVRVRTDYAKEGMPDGCVPGAWHVRRNNRRPELPTYIPIIGPGGTYRDPDSRVVAELASRDLRRREVKERILLESRIDSPHKQKDRDLAKEQRLDVMKEDFRAAKRVRGEGGLKKNFSKKGVKVA